MQWSDNAVIGFKANSELYEIHRLSGRNANTIACQNSPRNVWSNVVYQLRKCVQSRPVTGLLPLMIIIINLTIDLLELPFLYLDGNRTYLPSAAEDSVSDQVLIQDGFPFGNSNQMTVYV